MKETKLFLLIHGIRDMKSESSVCLRTFLLNILIAFVEQMLKLLHRVQCRPFNFCLENLLHFPGLQQLSECHIITWFTNFS